MKLAIMQPYFFPYIGYFQLMNAVDEFVVYDNIEFTKKGWINRNRILLNGESTYITLPLRKDSDFLNICERFISESWLIDKHKMLQRIEGAYKKAPFFDFAFPLIEKIVLYEERNLFRFIYNSLLQLKEYLEIPTSLIVSSTLPVSQQLKGEEKVIEICKERKANKYINPIGGIQLYRKEEFKMQNIDLCFLKTETIEYLQFKNDFVSSLSIVDVIMFNSQVKTKGLVKKFVLL